MADKSLNKTELVAKIAASTGRARPPSTPFSAVSSTRSPSPSVRGTKVSIPGWLAVERTHRAARTGRNPQTGATIQIPAGYSVKVSAGTKLKAAARSSIRDSRRGVRHGPAPLRGLRACGGRPA